MPSTHNAAKSSGLLRAACLTIALSPVLASAMQSPSPPPPPSPAPSPSSDNHTWQVPDEAHALKNPMPPSADNIKKGAALFKRYCVPCHGPEGKGDGPIAHYWVELPKNLSDTARQDRLSDGEIFWKLSRGHRQGADVIMPSFAERISSADDRWRLVLFVRSLRAAPVPPKH
jgi:mono/diheme cytochrome c family protein